jgi:hypothetical protein
MRAPRKDLEVWRPQKMKVDYMGFWITVSGLRVIEDAGKPVFGRFTWAIRRHGKKRSWRAAQAITNMTRIWTRTAPFTK